MKRTILIVEDNEDIRGIYGTFLRHFGYDVVEAENGYEGVDMARRAHPDLILMDLAMPILDGFEATQVLKADEETASIPILVVSAHSVPENQRKAERLGCSGFLGKPVEPRRLVQEMERILEDPADPPAGDSACASLEEKQRA